MYDGMNFKNKKVKKVASLFLFSIALITASGTAQNVSAQSKSSGIECKNSFIGTPLTYSINKDSVKIAFDGYEYGGAIDGDRISINGDRLAISVSDPELVEWVGASTLYVPIDSCPASLPMGIQYFIP